MGLFSYLKSLFTVTLLPPNNMTPEFIEFTSKFIIPHEIVYAKGHYGDVNFGVVENVPGDVGGTTYDGIDKASHPKFDFTHPTLQAALAQYWEEFLAYECDKLPAPLCWVYQDCCVNNGYGAAKKILLQTTDAKEFINLRIAKYKSIAAHNAGDQKFLKGWLARMSDLSSYLKLS